MFLTIAQESVRLPGARDVAGKENDACWLNLCQQRSKARRKFRAVETDD